MPSREFERKGLDVHSKETITLVDALKGCDLGVHTIHGLVTVKINPGTQPGDIRKLKGKGVFDSSSKRQGDHIVQIQVSLPKISSDTAKSVERALSEHDRFDSTASSRAETGGVPGFLRKLRNWVRVATVFPVIFLPSLSI